MAAPSGCRLRVLADRYRADVHQTLGLGDGHCGFSMPMHHFGVHRPIRIACIDPPVVLGTLDLSAPRAAKAFPPIVFEREDYFLAVDRPVGGHVSGWVANTASPMFRPRLRLLDEGRIVAEQGATLFRDEAAKVLPDGYRGFRFSVPTTAKELALADVESGSVFPISRDHAHRADRPA